jgi:hypothetical protein
VLHVRSELSEAMRVLLVKEDKNSPVIQNKHVRIRFEYRKRIFISSILRSVISSHGILRWIRLRQEDTLAGSGTNYRSSNRGLNCHHVDPGTLLSGGNR